MRDVTKRPSPARAIPPSYPKELKAKGISGEVIVEVIVSENGEITNARVIKATNQQFADAAMAAVVKWKMHPGQLNGAPVKCRVQLPFDFSIVPDEQFAPDHFSVVPSEKQ
jgi:TonB family protein